MVDYYEDAEEYLDHLSDEIPLFTNTREGVFTEGTRTAPAPLEANSDLFVSPMRAQLASRRAQKAAMPTIGGVASAAALFGGSAPSATYQPSNKVKQPHPPSEPAQPIEIPDLQEGIADLQMDDDDDDEDIDSVEEDFGDIPVVPASRSEHNSPMMKPKNSSPPSAEKSPSLPDNMMSELAFAHSEGRDVSPHVVQGLVQIMRDGAHEKRKKATIAMCNLCCESQQVLYCLLLRPDASVVMRGNTKVLTDFEFLDRIVHMQAIMEQYLC